MQRNKLLCGEEADWNLTMPADQRIYRPKDLAKLGAMLPATYDVIEERAVQHDSRGLTEHRGVAARRPESTAQIENSCTEMAPVHIDAVGRVATPHTE